LLFGFILSRHTDAIREESMVDRITRLDDLDRESTAAERINFSVRGQDYEIDLTEEHAQEFDEALEKYVTAARKVEPQPVMHLVTDRTRRRTSGSARDDIQEIRQWAKDNGYEVNPRGRIKKEIIEAYDEAHRSS
jgi:hypothetical protein